jgi:hypothetical protein
MQNTFRLIERGYFGPVEMLGAVFICIDTRGLLL